MTLYSQPDINQDADATPALFNDRFDAIANILNGHIDQTNIADGSITGSKIASGAVTPDKMNQQLSEIINNFVVSGGIVALSSGLVGSFSDITYYMGGQRLTKTGVANNTYTASKDTYVDINNAGNITYTAVANGAASPALTSGYMRLAKVITSGSAITSVVQVGSDSLGNIIYPMGAASAAYLQNPYKFSVYQNSDLSVSSGVLTKAHLDTKQFDTGNNFDSVTNFRFVAPIAGFYQISAQIGVSAAGASAGVAMTAQLQKNGSTAIVSWVIDGSASANRIPRLHMSRLVQLAANDYLELFGQINESTRAIGGGDSITFMSGFLVSRV